MRLVTFADGSAARVGIELEGTVRDTGLGPIEVLAELAEPRLRERLERSAGRPVYRLEELRVLAPVPRPGKVIGIGMNYVDHCREQGIEPPTQPLIFAKFATSVIGTSDPIWWPVGLTDQVDWEVELAVVLGNNEQVAGYTVANDVSARDLQFGDGQFVRSKSLNSFCPMGPVMVTADELGDPGRLQIWLDRNGRREQDSNTANLVFGVRQLVEFCARCFTLEPGDVILTGTPPGVGTFRKPPEYLRAGDVIVAGIERIGLLRNPVEGARSRGVHP